MSLLTKPEELKEKTTFAGLIYGQPGVGKSTLALSAPNPVCIDSDKGMHRVQPYLRVPCLQPETYDQVLQLFQSGELNTFETLVFDTAGELITLMEPYLIKLNPKAARSNGALTQAGYGDRKREFANLIKLAKQKGKNLLFVAHEKEDGTSEDKKIRPDIGGSSREDLIKLLDFVGYMEMVGKKRTISFTPCDKYYAKNSLELDDVIEIPNTDHGNTFITEKIVKMTKERLTQEAKLREKYNEIIKEAEKQISNQKDINKALEVIKELETIWDSKLRIWNMIQESAKTQGLTYNKETKKFEGQKVTPTEAQAINDEAAGINETIQQ